MCTRRRLSKHEKVAYIRKSSNECRNNSCMTLNSVPTLLNNVSDERIQQTLRLMGRRETRLSPEVAREVCVRTGSTAVLEGSIVSLGNQYVLGLRAEDCRTGDILDEEQVQAIRKEEVLHALDQIAVHFRTRVGESLASVQKHDRPLAEATTQSLEALEAYSRGWQLVYSNQLAAIPFFSQAVEIDPQFAMAHAALGLMYGHTGESGLAAEHTAKAYALRERASENEKFFSSAYYEGRTTGNQEKAEQICQAWSWAYPRDVTPHAFLSGFIYTGLSKYERSQKPNGSSKSTLMVTSDITTSPSAICTSDVWDKRKRRFEGPLTANWKCLILLFRDTMWRFWSLTTQQWRVSWHWPRVTLKQKTGSHITKHLCWRILVTCARRGNFPCRLGSWPGRDIANERLCSKLEQPCGKHSSGTLLLPGSARP